MTEFSCRSEDVAVEVRRRQSDRVAMRARHLDYRRNELGAEFTGTAVTDQAEFLGRSHVAANVSRSTCDSRPIGRSPFLPSHSRSTSSRGHPHLVHQVRRTSDRRPVQT